jgi:hypothetical protein
MTMATTNNCCITESLGGDNSIGMLIVFPSRSSPMLTQSQMVWLGVPWWRNNTTMAMTMKMTDAKFVVMTSSQDVVMLHVVLLLLTGGAFGTIIKNTGYHSQRWGRQLESYIQQKGIGSLLPFRYWNYETVSEETCEDLESLDASPLNPMRLYQLFALWD